MKKLLFLLFACAAFISRAQEHACARHKQAHFDKLLQHQARTANLLPQISHELKYDVKFVHLDLNLERNTKYVSGNVKTVATVIAASLDTFQTLLHQNFTIDSVKFNGVTLASTRKDSLIKVKPQNPLSTGSTFTVVIWYKGTAPTGGAAIGSGYNTGTSGAWGNQVSWSLSEAVVAYHWWPCKQILTDKIDSSWVFVTTDSTNKAGSNGLLKNVVTIGNKKRYEWKSRYPIAYYLISVAIARYKEYRQYAKPFYLPNDSILIQNYIYDNAINSNGWISTQKVQLDKMPQVLDFMSNMFGMYPFHQEKYGHCMTPFAGGMEHQTMTSLGFFDYYLDAHELGHQWWGNQVTCKSWGDIWINEGFAVYSEFLTAQYLDPANFASEVNSAHNSVMSQPGGSIFFTDTLNSTRIFSSRLTYNKGGSILHTLRFVTNNDSLWFSTLRGFQNAFKHSTASAVDFKNYYETATGIDATQFFNQWYYGQGYPTFDVKYNQSGNVCYIQSIQSTSTPSSIALFITPMEYRITRSGASDTTVRVMHSNSTETYTFALSGTVTGVVCDPNNWIINKVIGPTLDPTIGMEEQSVLLRSLSIGPNPTKGLLNIHHAPSSNLKVCVSDASGRKIGEYEGAEIDLSAKPAGIYLLGVQTAAGEKVFRVVKE